MLDWLRAGSFANRRNELGPRRAVIPQDPDFDQLVALEVGVDLAGDFRGEARVPDHNDGLQVVGLGAQPTALAGSQIGHRDCWCGCEGTMRAVRPNCSTHFTLPSSDTRR